MSLRAKLLVLLLVIYCGGGYYLTRKALEQVRPRYLESMEESLVDTSVLLASLVETQVSSGGDGVAALRRAFEAAQRSKFEAQIFTLHKTAIDLRVYVTDRSGRVLFDSGGRDEGRDYSQWNDVYRTLRGQYGARSTRDIPGDDDTQVLYVAAPIRQAGEIVGVVSAGKPTRGINQLVEVARRRILLGGIGGGVLLLVILLLAASWVVAPIERLTAHARAIRDRRPTALPRLPGRTLRDLSAALEEMRDALEGRKEVERYTQALAHEVKAPLAAIRGAAELLGEDMPVEKRRQFLANIRGESARIQQIVDRLMALSSIEARKMLADPERIEAAALFREAADGIRTAFEAKRISLAVEGGEGRWIRGERTLLREALVNLLQNSLEFTPQGGRVTARAVDSGAGRIRFEVLDSGPGVPEYALGRAFERFYSLPRPDSGRKSTGLGLSLVREIAVLHGGDASLENLPGGGACAAFWIPASV